MTELPLPPSILVHLVLGLVQLLIGLIARLTRPLLFTILTWSERGRMAACSMAEDECSAQFHELDSGRDESE